MVYYRINKINHDPTTNESLHESRVKPLFKSSRPIKMFFSFPVPLYPKVLSNLYLILMLMKKFPNCSCFSSNDSPKVPNKVCKILISRYRKFFPHVDPTEIASADLNSPIESCSTDFMTLISPEAMPSLIFQPALFQILIWFELRDIQHKIQLDRDHI